MNQPLAISALDRAKDTVRAAIGAGNAAAIIEWEKDGKQDCGDCGNVCAQLDARSFIAKAALELGVAWKSGKEVWVRLTLPEGIRTQHSTVYQAQMRAFVETIRAAGYGGTIRKYWNYVD